MSAPGWNPRWVNYARVHGRTPDEQLAHDRVRYPGGSMAGFIIWGRQQVVEFSHAHPEAFTASGLVDHAAYDRWLDALNQGGSNGQVVEAGR